MSLRAHSLNSSAIWGQHLQNPNPVRLASTPQNGTRSPDVTRVNCDQGREYCTVFTTLGAGLVQKAKPMTTQAVRGRSHGATPAGLHRGLIGSIWLSAGPPHRQPTAIRSTSTTPPRSACLESTRESVEMVHPTTRRAPFSCGVGVAIARPRKEQLPTALRGRLAPAASQRN